jgi:hypothetical protein
MEVAEKPWLEILMFLTGQKVKLSLKIVPSHEKNATRGLDWMVVRV